MPKKYFLIDIYTLKDYDCIKGTGYLTGNTKVSYKDLSKKEEME